MSHTRRIRSKVAGVSHLNDDGSSRQRAIKKHCRAGGELSAIPETNRRAAGGIAVALWTPGLWGRSQVGYIQDDLASDVIRHLRAGGTAHVRILEVTGGTWGKLTRGVNFEIELIPAGSMPSEPPSPKPKKPAAARDRPKIGDWIQVGGRYSLRAGAAAANSLVAGYRKLPGWAQPIAWGFGLGGFVVVIAILFRAFR